MLRLMLDFYTLAQNSLSTGVPLDDILNISSREQIGRSKYIEETNLGRFDELSAAMRAEMGALTAKEAF
jgi:vacuolar-type H+-ATPase catalytic subunit A/Vma1